MQHLEHHDRFLRVQVHVPILSHPTQSATAGLIMDSNKHPNQARKPTLTPQEPKDTGKPSAKSITSTKTTHGSLSSASGSGYAGNGNHGTRLGNTQREASTLQKWLEQTPRDEPWRPGSRRA